MPPTDYKLYYVEHKEVISERSRINYLENKQKYLEHQKSRYYNKREEIIKMKKIKIACACGGRYRKCSRTRHTRTNKHKRYLEELALANGLILVDEIDQIE